MEDIDMSKSNHERRMRYSIRKFSVGVASVAVASLFMGSVVHATVWFMRQRMFLLIPLFHK